MQQVIVIGGGAAGLMAACTAARRGRQVLLLEKNEKLGKKIYITGKGRCNVTNDCSPEEFLAHVVNGGKFLTRAAYAFPPEQTMRFFEEQGLALKVERGGRVFPVSDHASDVTKALERACRAAGVAISLGEEVLSVEAAEGDACAVHTQKGRLACDAVVVATGGLSYPSTGSTGDGYRFAAALGHVCTPLYPSLVGIELEEAVDAAQGVSLKNVVLTAKQGKKTVFSEMGELLFTHYGVSGPLVLTLSALLNGAQGRTPRDVRLQLDFKPALEERVLEERLLRDFAARKNEAMKNVMRGLLPAGVVGLVLRAARIAPEKQANAVTREERRALLAALKAFPLTPRALRGFEEAVVTAGGVSLREVDPATMGSRLVKGLYFCGEVLDCDAFTGGYNLQIAFCTGFLAGQNV